VINIASYLDAELVIFLDADTREETLNVLVDMLDAKGKLKDKEAFLEAVVAREKLVSTGIGMGVAIPHAKLSSYDDFFIAIGILKKGVDWDSLDAAPVRIVFMIGGPDDKQTEYLQILSRLTFALKDEIRRKKMLQLSLQEEIVGLFDSV
jgi:PTS system nitrogen regulatory IIA component